MGSRIRTWGPIAAGVAVLMPAVVVAGAYTLHRQIDGAYERATKVVANGQRASRNDNAASVAHGWTGISDERRVSLADLDEAVNGLRRRTVSLDSVPTGYREMMTVQPGERVVHYYLLVPKYGFHCIVSADDEVREVISTYE